MRTQMIILTLREPERLNALPEPRPPEEAPRPDRLGLTLDVIASLAIVALCAAAALEVLGGI